jgi:hypothetical protein
MRYPFFHDLIARGSNWLGLTEEETRDRDQEESEAEKKFHEGWM